MEGGQDTSKSLICAVRVGRVERVRVLVHLVYLTHNRGQKLYAPEFWTNRQSLTPLPYTLGAAVVGDVCYFVSRCRQLLRHCHYLHSYEQAVLILPFNSFSIETQYLCC